MMQARFHPLLRNWFARRFGQPTPAQEKGWPVLQDHRHVLIAAPTGGGKTLAAFFVAIDQLIKKSLAGKLEEGTEILYLSPLRALSNDIKKNLEEPLGEISNMLKSEGLRFDDIRIGLRTGDTTAYERGQLIKKPPHILVTTPESLFLMLSSPRARQTLKSVKTVIVDEIHALARDKRGSHLSLSLEQLDTVCDVSPVRVGLSATQRPLEMIADFLVGGLAGERACEIVDVTKQRDADIAILLPEQPLGAVCSGEQWEDLYSQLHSQINEHRSSLIFVNTRRMAERITFQLSERLGPDAVACHHGSLSKEKRLDAEDRLKRGQIKAIVATASLELGIDIGTIDLVCQVGSPRSIAAFVQRVGRSGHALGLKPKARLIALTRDELVECLALVRAYRVGAMDRVEIPHEPIDILAQHIVAMIASEEKSPGAVYEIFRRAYSYRSLEFSTLEKILGWLSEGLSQSTRRGAYLHWDKMNDVLRPRRNARLSVVTSGGAIPEMPIYRVVQESDMSPVGTVDEEFAIESSRGDVFLLGNHSWQIEAIRGDTVLVKDLHGAPPTIPFWIAEAGGRTYELSEEISKLRDEADRRLEEKSVPDFASQDDAQKSPEWKAYYESLQTWIEEDFGCERMIAAQAAEFLAAQKLALGILPSQKRIVFERFFDETGGMQLIVHAPFGSRINRAWGLAFRKRFCRGFDFELQASATDNGILLSVGPNQSFPLEAMFRMLNAHNCRSILIQALLDVPMFEIRWRWNVTRALAVLRSKGGKRVPPHLQRYQANDLLTAVFPQQTQCFEHRTGDLEVPDHPLVQQTVRDCLQEAMDADRFERVMKGIDAKDIELIARDTREPSPFCYELIHANPYAFLDDAPLEERRVRALNTRFTLDPQAFKELTALAPEAISQVTSEAWPLIRDADELYDALKQLVLMDADSLGIFSKLLQMLVDQRRVGSVVISGRTYYHCHERDAEIAALYTQVDAEGGMDAGQALQSLLRGQLECRGPLTSRRLAEEFALSLGLVDAALFALEGQGIILSGYFTGPEEKEWCERRLLQRMHRLTIEGLREQIKAVPVATYIRFLERHTKAHPETRVEGMNGLESVIAQLQGLEAPAMVWEQELFASRLQRYSTQDLDLLGQSGKITWARFSCPKIDKPSKNRLFSRVTPMAFAQRLSLPWILAADRTIPIEVLTENAKTLWSLMKEKGALFFDDLVIASRLLPTQAEDALSELMSVGLVQSDSFASIRPLINPDRKVRSSAGGHARNIRYASDFRSGGRFSPFAQNIAPPPAESRLETWVWQLLNRYGIIFRDLLQREVFSPRWGELLPLLRTLEARGLIRGGRFVDKVGGEQFALKEAVESLRRLREIPDDTHFLVISASDPLNQMGILTKDEKIAQKAAHRIALMNGRYIAYKADGKVQFLEESLPAETKMRIDRALRLNGLFRQHDPFLKSTSPAQDSASSSSDTQERRSLKQNWRKFVRDGS